MIDDCNTPPYDIAVFVGRFSPLHLGHCHVIQRALDKSKFVAILVGSSFAPRNYRNPWLFEERRQMILDSFPNDQHRITVLPLEDTTYNDALWVQNVQHLVSDVVVERFGQEIIHVGRYPRICLIGHSKDNSSYYLKLFPQWESINVPGYVNEEFVLSSTHIRDWYFSDQSDYFLQSEGQHLTDATRKFLAKFNKTSAFKDILEEYRFVQTYKKSWSSAPYEPVFVTVDACVVQSGHILLVKRKSRPGKGLWALPGGFLQPDERIIDGVLRELREETKIKVPLPVLRGSIVATRVFDDPFRSSRGRTITHAHLIQLSANTELPQVKGSDDAEKAKWVPLGDLRREDFFEDHFDMINALVALL